MEADVIVRGCTGERSIPFIDFHRLPGNTPERDNALERGDLFTHASAGGGGFGDPFGRDPAAVLEDVRDGKVTVAAARERYGVVLTEHGVDDDATRELRAGR